MLKRIGAEESGEFKAVASGTLPSGKPVVVNADGTVSVVSGSDASIGSAAVFESASTGVTAATFDSSNNKIVICYRDLGNSSHGTAVVGTVSGSSISFGTPVVFNAAATGDELSVIFDSNSNKVVVVYATSSQGLAIVGTVSGTSISFGSATVFDAGQGVYMGGTFDSTNNKVVVVYAGTNNYAETKVGTVSGTSISFGTAVVAMSLAPDQNAITFDSNRGKVVVCSRVSTKGRTAVGTVSGTSISFATNVIFADNQTKFIAATFDSNSNKVVIAYINGSSTDQGQAVVGDIDGSGVISFGSAVTYNAEIEEVQGIAFDSNANKVIVAYDSKGTSKGQVISGTVSGTSISFDSETVFEAANVEGVSVAFDSNANKSVISYIDGDNSRHGTSAVFAPASTTLTSENYIGMSSGNVTYDSATQAVGTAVVMNSGSTTGFAAAFDSSTGKVVVAFSDGTDGQKGKAIVGTVDPSNNSISFGSEVVFQNSEITGDQMDCVFDSNANKVVIFYTDTNNPSTNSRTGTAIVGTVSGTSISFGTKAAFESGNTQYIAATFDSNLNKVVVAYRDTAHSARGKAIVGTVSGTDITFGSEADFSTANEVEYISATFDSNSNKVVISWSDKGNNSNAGTAIVGTVSGTSISFGSAVVFEAPITKDISSTFDTVNNKVIITYKDQGNSSYGTAIVGTVSGTSISFGTAVVFASAETEYTSVIYDANAEKILILFKDGANSNRPTIIVGTVSGTSISFGTEVVVMDVEGVTINPGVAFDSTNKKVVLSYIDTTGSDNGMAQVVQLAYDNTTRVNTADGNRTSINIIGSVIDNQNSLTAGQQYFVQTDGTIGTTAATPSVLAGTAISATELLVKT